MKFTYNEFDTGFWVDMEPENLKETAQLARIALNAKVQAAQITMYFSGDQPTMNIHINKISKKAQRNSITRQIVVITNSDVSQFKENRHFLVYQLSRP